MSFHRFADLPTELQLQIWQSAFHLGPALCHGGLFVFTLCGSHSHPHIVCVRKDYFFERTGVFPNTCMVASCVDHHTDGEEVDLGLTSMLNAEGGRTGSGNVVIFRDTGLVGLLQSCYLSRIAVLEAWKVQREGLIGRAMKRKKKWRSGGSARHYSQNVRMRKDEAVLAVVQKLLESMRRAAFFQVSK